MINSNTKYESLFLIPGDILESWENQLFKRKMGSKR